MVSPGTRVMLVYLPTGAPPEVHPAQVVDLCMGEWAGYFRAETRFTIMLAKLDLRNITWTLGHSADTGAALLATYLLWASARESVAG